MNAGRFDTLVEIWRYTSTANDYGEAVKTWTKLSDIYARVDYLNGTEGVNAEQWQNKQGITVMVRYTDDLTVKDRVKHGNDYYNVIAISEIDRRMYLKLQCQKTI